MRLFKNKKHHFYQDYTYCLILKFSKVGKEMAFETKPYYISFVDEDETYIVANGERYDLHETLDETKFFIDKDGTYVNVSNCLIKELELEF